MDSHTLQKTNESLESFLSTAGELGDLYGILKHILQTALKLFEADTCFCIAFHPATECLMEHYSMMISSQQESSTLRLGSDIDLQILAQYVLHHRGVLFVENVDESQNSDELHGTFMRARNIRSFAAT